MLGCYLSGMAAWSECGYKVAAAVKNGTYQRIRCGCMFEMRALNKLHEKRKTSRIRQKQKQKRYRI